MAQAANAKEVPFLVLTGGPCAGKSTAKTFLLEKLGDAGFYPMFRPELPTLLMDSGITPLGDMFPPGQFQRSVVRTTLALDNEMRRMASLTRHPKPVIITDRGLFDVLPYCESKNQFEKLLSEVGIGFLRARDEYATAVYHLRTAALGAEEYYTLANNRARYESAEQARERDQATWEAWNGTEHFRTIPNRGTFEDKLKHLLAEICSTLGIPEPVETEHKFLVDPRIPLKKLGPYQEVDIEQFYLVSNNPDEELRFRKRSQHDDSVYFRTVKRPTPDKASRYETQSFITAREYEFGKQFMQPNSRCIRKKRICFAYEDQHFELDRFLEPKLPYAMLELELIRPGAEFTLPPFLAIEREVTGNKAYSNRALANL